MAYSYKEYTSASATDGGRTYTYTFDAVDKNTTNIKVTIGGKHLYDGVTEYNITTRLPGSGSTPVAEYTVSSGSITILASYAAGAVTFTVGSVTVTAGVPTLSATIPLRIYRETNRTTAEVSFASGSILSDSDLNKANNQARFLGLEAVDRANESVAIDSEDSTQYDIQIGGTDKRIYGVEDPENSNDAASKAYVDGVAMGSGVNIATLAGTQTLTNKTLTSPVIGTKISDTNDKELVNLTATTDAVNEFTIANATTGNAPTLSATGSDDNIDITLTPKGTGEVVIGTGSASGKITTNSTQDLVLDTNSGTNSGTITITDGADGNIDITPNGTGEVNISKVDIDGGTINGITDLAVADGGTGASTLTDGGVLLGSGGDAITAMAVLADSEMIVGDGTGDPVAESGSTLRTSIGVDPAGTDNSTDVTLSGTPDYITISDQTITRNQIDLTADVTGTLPVADGGTGVTSKTGTGSVVLSSSPTLVTPALGTPASGVLTDCTFPTGHIINVTVDSYTAEPNTNNTSLEVIDVDDFAVTVSPASSSSTFFIIVFLSGVDCGDWVQFDLYRAIGASTTANLSGQTNGLVGGIATFMNDSDFTYTYLDSPSTETDITYAPSAKSTHISHTWNINDSDYSSRITVFEIAG